jgi:hypothetical protein
MVLFDTAAAVREGARLIVRYFGEFETSLANSQPAPWQREQSLRPALTIKKGSVGIARPEALQRLQLRTGSLTRTSPFPRHTGHTPSSIGLPAQSPQVLDEYADIQPAGNQNEL